ncbi:RNA-binding protein squid [Anabrus simplex]|uniref:RNA-binding protein squid n=1 Tax=Anabrus simplex TaxID=316456 RepID=UPI0035A2BB02
MADRQSTPMENGGSMGEESGEQEHYNGSGEGGKEDRKLFVGGLSPGTTEEHIKSYFSKYGSVENVNIKTDPTTGRSRGFAFVSFASPDNVNQILSAGNHVINGKKVDCKKAKARIGKVFVGGLSPEISDADIRSYFSQFGTIVEIEAPFDKVKNRRKGFCFISFESENVANDLLKRPKQTINGKQVDVKRVNVQPTQGMGAMLPAGRGRGAGRGGMMATGAVGSYGAYAGYDMNTYKAYGRYDYHNSGYASDYTAYDYSTPNYTPYDEPHAAAVPIAAPAVRQGGGYSGGKQMGRGRQAPRQQPY